MPGTLTENFVEQFKLCAVTAGEQVAVIAELGEKDDYVAAAVAAARQLGASALVLHASSLSNPNLPPYPGRRPRGRRAAGGRGRVRLRRRRHRRRTHPLRRAHPHHRQRQAHALCRRAERRSRALDGQR
ncbi:hypothetical protein [Nocardioides sp. B-3]|uniref:hypothetical protein n=1 Tax=Nocardioides sp. B-3 TaxID=2895565 RepID=UPI002152BDAE|nr:hypothetical protein [Nocardioides sp. B-3]UUZ59491.1 hypothetical protein LP418_27570 [Nocardioides sp. B-3]